jgi:hypothetical protein
LILQQSSTAYNNFSLALDVGEAPEALLRRRAVARQIFFPFFCKLAK